MRNMNQIKRMVGIFIIIGMTGYISGAIRLPLKYVIPGNKFFPEGIAHQPATGDFFVGSTFDGTIVKGNIRSGQTSVFLPGGQDGRKSAVGMKLDNKGRLFIAGGMTGLIFVYNIYIKKLLARFESGSTPSFVNDAVITPNGDVYFTDSMSPVIYKISSKLQFSRWLDLRGSVVRYEPGFNFNGIVATENGKYLIAVQMNKGKLYRISTENKQVTEIKVTGYPPLNGDGLLLRKSKLIVVQNRLNVISAYQLSPDYASARFISRMTHPEFSFPTTAAFSGNDLLVVNGQLHKRGGSEPPVLPFSVLRVNEP